MGTKKKQQEETFKDEYDEIVLSLLPLSFLQGSRVADVEGPTEEETAAFFQNEKARSLLPIIRKQEEQHKQQEEQEKQQESAKEFLSPNIWSLKKITNTQQATNLRVHISLRTPQKQPLIVLYDQLEENTVETRQYQSPTPTKQKFRHVLLCGGATSLSKTQPQEDPRAINYIRSVDDWEDDQYHNIQWFPPEKNEFILNELESELAWLCEECLHALYRDTKTIDWDFIWNYASPSLKVEMRKLEFTEEEGENENDIHLKKLVRMGDYLVSRRFKVMRDWIKASLQSGYRRVIMKRAIAVLRLKPAEYAHEEQHENRSENKGNRTTSRPKRIFPPPEFHKARQTTKRKKRKR